jgi:hypothetical protein
MTPFIIVKFTQINTKTAWKFVARNNGTKAAKCRSQRTIFLVEGSLSQVLRCHLRRDDEKNNDCQQKT